MRSKLLVCAAIASIGVSHWFGSVSHAAEPKDVKKKPSELHADDKAMKRQTQWEDKVMGPDSKRAELEKIARARAINEKAEKDKETRDRQASLETAVPAPAASRKQEKYEKTEVSLLSPEKNDSSHTREISPKLATEAAQAPVAPSKPADDKFIDKLLREDDAPSKKHASASDRELENLLAGAGSKDKPAGRKHGDSVDDLLKSADKGPAMPAPRAQSGLPDWAKQPEIGSSAPPAPAPLALRTPAATRKNDNSGVIQVVQGAAGNGPAVVSPARPAPVAARASRKAAVAKAPAPVAWSDPFADKRPVAQAPKKEVASRPAPAAEGAWSDPFAEPSEGHKTVRHTTPASAPASAPTSAPRRIEKTATPSRGNDGNGGNIGNVGWKDPFTKAPSAPARASVAMREPSRGEPSKWEVAGRRPAAHASTSDRAGAWGIIKKRAR
jgi:hypothetical protein